MKNFDQLISAAQPAQNYTPKLDVKQFSTKLIVAKRIRRLKRLMLVLLALSLCAAVVAIVQRGIVDLVLLTFRYSREVPHLFKQYASAYRAVVPGLSLVATGFVGAFYWKLAHIKGKKLTFRVLRRFYYAGGIITALAIVLAVLGFQGGSRQAYAQQQNLRRALNQRGHIEVEVDGVSYEANPATTASDQLIRNQAFINSLRHYDISQAYPDLTALNTEGFVAEIRAVNPKDDCIFYVERRLEPALGKVVDANSGCFRSGFEVRYLNEPLQPVKNVSLSVNQAVYVTWAQYKSDPQKSTQILVLLSQKADAYVPQSIEQKVVEKGKPPMGYHGCGVNQEHDCPDTPLIDIYSDSCGECAGGSPIVGNGTNKASAQHVELFGKIKSMSAEKLVIETPWQEEWTIIWPYNVIEAYNQKGATYYKVGQTALKVEIGDSVSILANIDQIPSTKILQLEDIWTIYLVLEPAGANPLDGTYKSPKDDSLNKYRTPE